MPNSYSQVFVHLVFAVKYRQRLLHKKREDLYRYITGVIQSPKNRHKLYAIGGTADHIHILLSMHPTQSIADLVKDIKVSSSIWLNQQNLFIGHFSWQDGYGAFSLGMSQLVAVTQYILNQEEHHKRITFREEYIAFLKKYDIPYDERYVFGDLV
ncbi:MAG: IS200/IS605 family transposase [Thermoguttaceae bacterium]|nr:IS200/IS605 family transposase [Thermoguttaceae bacterium]